MVHPSGALSIELSRSRGNQAQNGAYKLMLVTPCSRNFEFRKRKLRSRNLSHCLKKNTTMYDIIGIESAVGFYLIPAV